MVSILFCSSILQKKKVLLSLYYFSTSETNKVYLRKILNILFELFKIDM